MKTMITEKDVEILARIGEFAFNTKGATKFVDGKVVCNIANDIMEECVAFVQNEIKDANEDRIITIINNVDLQNQINDFAISKQLENLNI